HGDRVDIVHEGGQQRFSRRAAGEQLVEERAVLDVIEVPCHERARPLLDGDDRRDRVQQGRRQRVRRREQGVVGGLRLLDDGRLPIGQDRKRRGLAQQGREDGLLGCRGRGGHGDRLLHVGPVCARAGVTVVKKVTGKAGSRRGGRASLRGGKEGLTARGRRGSPLGGG